MLALAKMDRGIVGVRGKRQVSVVVSNGRKDPQKSVIERDRFHLVEPTENKQKVKPYHQAFAAFNSAPAEKRRVLYGILTHLKEEDAFWYERKAQQLPISFYNSLGWFKNARENQKSAAHPNRLPACCGGAQGDAGKPMARRWFGPGPDDFKMIECPGKNCEFAIKTDKTKRPPCGPSLDFIFQLMWKDEFAKLPSVTARYVSHGWDTLENFVGFFNEIEEAVNGLGIQNPVLYGFPFMLSLGEKTKPSENWNWPVVTITRMMSPLDFFYMQTERRKQLKEMAAQIPAVITVSEEMAQRPTVYLMDEVGPLRIGVETVIDVHPEPIEENPTVPPINGKSQSAAAKESPNPVKLSPAVPEAADNGKNRLFPDDWGKQHEKLIVKGEITYQAASEKTLGEALDGKDKEKINYAVYELLYRATRAKKAFADKGESARFAEIIQDPDGNIEKIPPEFLVAKVEALKKAYIKLK